MPAMSFSTRSSTERKGSLQRTVRWAWSFSLRWTQSTVKSRRFSWARRMNSPRNFARVVCGGTDLASKMSMSRAARSTAPARWEQVVQPAAAVHVVVGEVELGDPRRGQREVVPGPVALDQLVLGDPVDLPRDQVEVAGLDRAQRALPHVQHPLADRVGAVLVGEILRPVQVLVLDVEGTEFAPVRQP